LATALEFLGILYLKVIVDLLVMIEKNRLVRINLLGFDPLSALELTKKAADNFGASAIAKTHIGGWSVLECEESGNAKAFAREVCETLFPKAFMGDPFAYAAARLKERRQKVTFAESCTGGLLAAYMTAVAGASQVFDGSLVAYSNRLKVSWLGVSERLLETYGAVSAECVEQMALGAIGRTDANYALSVSGVAGPGGGSEQKPVGTVFIGYASSDGATFAEKLFLTGARAQIQKQSVFQALRLLLNRL
jgi:nicotinamide-nucleotide amidase